jgi:hypothetical protein
MPTLSDVISETLMDLPEREWVMPFHILCRMGLRQKLRLVSLFTSDTGFLRSAQWACSLGDNPRLVAACLWRMLRYSLVSGLELPQAGSIRALIWESNLLDGALRASRREP